jgi:hypothetical protein
MRRRTTTDRDERRFIERTAGRHLSLRDTIDLALDAIDEGDWSDAERLLANAVGRLYRASRESYRCPCCGKRFVWPGQLQDHLQMVHPDQPMAA